jgi:hypothetical protein
MSRVPPVVVNRNTGGAAYLLAWERLPDRPGWWARLMWLEFKDNDTIRGAEARVHQRDVKQIQGQDYRNVPRIRVTTAMRVTPPTRATPITRPAGTRRVNAPAWAGT